MMRGNVTDTISLYAAPTMVSRWPDWKFEKAVRRGGFAAVGEIFDLHPREFTLRARKLRKAGAAFGERS